MNRRAFVLAVLGSLAWLAPVPAAAADAPDGALRWDSGAVLATARVFRGQQQTDGHAALSGEVKATAGNGAYAGIWAGTLDLGPGTDTHAEIDWFAGWSHRDGRWSVNTGYLYRQRPSGALALDFQELTASVGYDFGRLRGSVAAFHSWDYFQGGTSTYLNANVGLPITTVDGLKLIATASAGRYAFSNRAIGDYDDMDLRLIAVHGRWQFSLGYSDTDVHPARSGLLTRERCGPLARAQVLVMF